MEIINENGIKFNTDELFNVSRARLPRDTIHSNNKVYIKCISSYGLINVNMSDFHSYRTYWAGKSNKGPISMTEEIY